MDEIKNAIKETYEEKIKQTQQELEQKRIDQVQQMADDHRNVVQRLEGDILELQREKNKLGKIIVSIKAERNKNLMNCLQRINDCDAMREDLIRDNAKALRNKDKEIHSLKEENGELQDTINSQTHAYKYRIHELSSENVQLSSEKEALAVQISTLKQTHKDGMKQFRVQNSDLEGRNDDLHTRIADLKNEKEELSKQLSTTKDELSAKVDELASEKESLQKYKTKVEKYKGKVKIQETLNSQLIADKEELVNKLEKMTKEIKTIEKQKET
jgi:chromosome segregation ATPase